MSDVNDLLKKYEYKGNGVFEPEIGKQDFLFGVIKLVGPLTRTQLKNITGIPRTTIYDTVKVLIYRGLVEKYTIPTRRKGRRKIYYRITENHD